MFYLTLYVVTLVVHVLFMNYVLAGSAYVAWVSVFRGTDGQRPTAPAARVLRDWMPAALSAAITAGVAPLLFLQILYKKDFYTANLLLFHRWMAILPVLIVGFYLTYFLKSKRITHRHGLVRAAIGVGAFACFAFVAYSWTENHLLSQRSQVFKTAFYATSSIIYTDPRLLPRLGIWFFGAFPTMVWMLGWQLRYQRNTGQPVPGSEFKRLAVTGVVGLAMAGLCACGYLWAGPADEVGGSVIFGQSALVWTVSSLMGGLVLLIGLVWLAICPDQPTRSLALATVGSVVAILGATCVREVVRLNRVDLEPLYTQHAAAMKVGGLWVFLLFFAVNGVLIAWCFALARRKMGPLNA